MIKNYFFVILAAVTMLLVSCGNSQTTPQEIDGVEFTGNGLLGNFPYMMAHYDSERANLERKLWIRIGAVLLAGLLLWWLFWAILIDEDENEQSLPETEQIE